MDQKLRVAYEELNKISSRVEETFVKAKGTSITDAERHTIKAGLFDTTLKGESSKYNIKSVRHELGIAEERGNFASDELAQGRVATVTSFQNYLKSKGTPKSSGNNNTVNDTFVTVVDPESGEQSTISEGDLDFAINNGWELKQ
jgi:hypothetical protein